MKNTVWSMNYIADFQKVLWISWCICLEVKVTCMCICRQIKPFSFIVQLKMQLTRATAGLDRERINFTLPETSESESFKYSFKLSSGFEHTANQYLAFVKLSRKVLSEYVLWSRLSKNCFFWEDTCHGRSQQKRNKLYIDILWFIVLSTLGPRAGVGNLKKTR
jgi:hypothetical protein